MTSPPLIDANGLVAGYHGRAIVGPIDLELSDNDSLALVGPNGVGKSTILKTVAALIPPVAGTITYRARSVERDPPHVHVRNGLVFVGEHRANVLRTLTVEENLELATAGRRSPATSDPIDTFPRLDERRRQLAGTLSGGELQMLSLCMALALSPCCLLLDEPSAGLAPVVLDAVRTALAGLRGSGLCVIIAEQRLDVIRGLCDRIAVVADQQLSFLDADAEISTDTLAARYFGSDRTGVTPGT